MEISELKSRDIEHEFIFSASRSGGPGGQNVNKVSTKVELRFSLKNTRYFSEEEKEILFDKLKNKITREGEIVLTSQNDRSQFANKELVTEKFFRLVADALTPAKKRKASSPTFASKQERLKKKQVRSLVKKMRRYKGNPDD